ncbi:MAG: DUF1648 domain-containing protein [Sarcina sp.]
MAKWKPSEKHRKINLILDSVTVLIIIFLSGFTFKIWSEAGDRIPTHFNIYGQVDAYGSKHTLFLLLGIAIGMYLFFTLISKYPGMGNYIVPLHEGNREKQYNMESTFVKVMNLELALLFANMQVQILLASKNIGSGFSGTTMFVPLIIIGVSLVIYCRLSLKNK